MIAEIAAVHQHSEQRLFLLRILLVVLTNYILLFISVLGEQIGGEYITRQQFQSCFVFFAVQAFEYVAVFDVENAHCQRYVMFLNKQFAIQSRAMYLKYNVFKIVFKQQLNSIRFYLHDRILGTVNSSHQSWRIDLIQVGSSPVVYVVTQT